MDDRGFDALSRRVFVITSRRAVFAPLAGVAAMLTGFVSRPDAVAKRRRKRCLAVLQRCGPRRRPGCCGKATCRRGKCRCGKQYRTCRGRCISKQACCNNRECHRGHICSQGRCQCRPGQHLCDGWQCVNLKTSVRDCGECRFRCTGAATCQNGHCDGGSTYREVRRWSQEPWRPVGIAVDQAGLVYVDDTANDSVWKFTASGDVVDSWSVPDFPSGIDVTPDGVVYVAVRSTRQILTFTSDGSPGPITINVDNEPEGLAVNPSGDVYAAFPFLLRAVQRFNPDGTLNDTWEDFVLPLWTAVAPNGDVYVMDNNILVVWLSAAGAIKGEWGGSGAGNGKFINGFGITVDRAGFVYVADRVLARVQKFTASGQFVGIVGGPDVFDSPRDVAVSRSGMVYVVDEFSREIVQLEPA